MRRSARSRNLSQRRDLQDHIQNQGLLPDYKQEMLLSMGRSESQAPPSGYKHSLTPSVYQIIFEIENPTEHHHIPLLISPYSYTTYRGS